VAAAYSSGNAIGIETRPGNVYLVEEKRPKLSYELLEQSLSAGYAGMVVTREFPKRLLSEKELASCRVVWLTNLVGEDRINPTAIGILMSQLRSFIEGQPRTVLMIDGLEYLVSLNTYDRMLQFMHQLKDIVATNESIMLVPIDPRTVAERELALLERSLEPIIPRADIDMPEEPMLSTDGGAIRLLESGRR
jgi:hypothetical protein